MDGTQTGINNNPDNPRSVTVFVNANPGMLVGDNAGVDTLHKWHRHEHEG